VSEGDRTHDAALAAELEEARQLIATLAPQAERGALLDELIARLPDGFALIDPGGAILDVNDAFCEMTGYSRDELVGAAPLFPFCPPEETAAIEAAFAAFLRGETGTRELTFMRADGSRFPVFLTPTIIRDADGAMRLGMATFKDVSSLRLAEGALKKSEADFRALVENLSDVLVRYDLDLRFTYVSPVISTVVPMRPEDLLGKTNREAGFPEEVATIFDDVLRRCLSTLAPVSAGFRIQGHEGERIGESRVYPELDINGRPTSIISISRDITDRALARDALRESEENYRALVERANDAVVIIDAERCLFGNEMAARLSGYTVEELADLPLVALLPESAREQLLDRARRRLTGEELPRTYVTDLVHRDGTLFKAEVSAGVITYRGAPTNLLIVREVTARVRAEEALRRSEAMRDTSERVAGVGSYRWDLTTQHVEYSPEMFRLFDIDRDSFDGDFVRVVHSRVHPDDVADLLEAIADFTQTGRPRPQEFRVVHRDGTTLVLHGEASLETDAGGLPAATVGYYQDITHEREAQRQLREAEERYRSLFEQSPLPMWEQDVSALMARVEDLRREGVTDLGAHLEKHPEVAAELSALARIVSVNAASLDLFGASSTEELIREFPRCLTEETISRFTDGIPVFAAGAGTYSARSPFRRLDGSDRVMDYYVSLVAGRDGRLDRALVSYIDVTERELAVAEVHRLNAELEERVVTRTAQRDALNRELEGFAYSASHDLRAPLRAIDGFSAMVVEDAADRLTADDVAHLQRVRGAAQRMGDLIDDLLGLSRISRRELVRVPVDVSGLAAHVVAELRADHPGRHVDARIQPGMVAYADQALLRVILFELLDNAWKFTAKSEAAVVDVGATSDDGHLVFFVRDDGAGYDPRFAEHLFGAFQRLHPTADYPGNGIGLATVQRLVARHGGSVWAQSEVGHGATFMFTLPHKPDERRADAGD
jgi:PAS domain S-box-containing protein